MEKQAWKKISRILDIALTLPQERRTTYIQNLCGDDTELQVTINKLLESVEESDKMLDKHLRNNEALLQDLTTHLEQSEAPQSLTGSTLGRWKITELLGRGGMGDVYKAERTESDIHQQGALKIMRRGFDTPENIRRFRLEKQILAGLHHPNIASLIDGGVNEDGLPYLVMEYVNGQPIDEYCDNHRLSIDKRLHLFKTVCQAVQHAHKNLIIHRDLKPENILVTGEEHVKILDFGIAKLLDPDLYELSMVETRQHMRLMSLEYAAPEQITGEPVTTSTDVYSLGILLYKLLAGLHPLDFEDKCLGEIERAILHETPPNPSRRINDSENAGPIATARSTKKKTLINELGGDSGAIIMKAMRKETDKRYETVGQLVDDLDRYDTHQPVGARLDSTRYRFSKFYQRHKKGMAITAAALAVIITLVTFYTARLAQQRNEAQMEKNKAEAVTQFLTSLFEPSRVIKSEIPTARDLLDIGAQKINTSFDKKPVLRAEMMALLGRLYFLINEYEEAKPLLKKSITLAGKYDDIGTQIEALISLSQLNGRTSDLKKRIGTMQKAVGLLKAAGKVPSLLHARIIQELHLILSARNRKKEALELTKKSLTSARNAPHLSIEAMYYYLRAHGAQLTSNGYYNRAKMIYNEALNLDYATEKEPFRHFALHEYLLTNAYYRGDKEAAFSLQHILLQEVDGLFPEIHGATAHLYDIIVRSLLRFGRFEEAEKFMRKSLALQKKIYPGERRLFLAFAHEQLGYFLAKTERYSNALKHLKQARELLKVLFGRKNRLYYRSTARMADVIRQQGRYQKSEELMTEALALSHTNTKSYPESDKIVRLLLAKLRLDQGRPAEALRVLNKIQYDYYLSENKNKDVVQHILVTRARVYTRLEDIKQAKAAYSKAINLGDQISSLIGITWPQLLCEYARFLVKHNDPEAKIAVKRALKVNRKFYGDTQYATQQIEELLASMKTR